MDYIKLAILVVSCTGGFMATSYEPIAREQGWPIGYAFSNPMSFPIITGWSCLFGSAFISALVNLW